jgi:hypothetical protein
MLSRQYCIRVDFDSNTSFVIWFIMYLFNLLRVFGSFAYKKWLKLINLYNLVPNLTNIAIRKDQSRFRSHKKRLKKSIRKIQKKKTTSSATIG